MRQNKACLYIFPIVVFVLWLVILEQWTLGFSAFTTYSYVLKKAGPLPRPMPTLNLINRFGEHVQSDSFKGKYVLLTFIYLHCPTACPIVLAKFMRIYSALENEIPDKLLIATISIDNQRDTPESLNSTWNMFGQPRGWFVGSLASEVTTSVPDALSDLGVWAYQRSDGLFNHSTYIFLVNPDGEVIRIFQLNQTSEEIVRILREITAAPGEIIT